MKIMAFILVIIMMAPFSNALWSSPQKISSEKFLPNPVISSDGKDIYIFWKSENGSSLSYCIVKKDEILSSKAMHNVSIGTLSVKFDGKYFNIVFSSDSIHYLKIDEKGDILRHIMVNANSPMDPDIAIDRKHNIHFAWIERRNESYEVYYGLLIENNFSEEKIYQSNYTCKRSRIQVDSDDFVHILWYEQLYHKRMWYAKLHDRKLLIEKILKEDAYWPSFDIDKKNNLHIVWQDGECRGGKGVANILYTIIDKNASIVQQKKISIEKDMKPDILVDKNGDSHVVWCGMKGIYYANISEEGKIKKYKIVDIKSPQYPLIAFANATPYVVFEKWEGGEKPYSLYYVYRISKEENNSNESPIPIYLLLLGILIAMIYRRYHE